MESTGEIICENRTAILTESIVPSLFSDVLFFIRESKRSLSFKRFLTLTDTKRLMISIDLNVPSVKLQQLMNYRIEELT
jgi:hypothetical protein